MATYTEVIKFEEEAPQGVLRLVKSGEFYRAYNHSAWLFQCCIAEHRVIRKYIKALQRDIYYIGFPEKSLFNNIGERSSIKTPYGFDILLAAAELPAEEGYASWLTTVEAAEASKGDHLSLPLAGAEAEREVLRRLREYPLENKTLVESVVFLAALRSLLAND